MKAYLITLFLAISFAHTTSAFAADLAQAVRVTAIDKVQKYFDNLTTIEADFIQTDSDGNSREGRFYLSRPKKMKIQYFTPEEEMILMDGAALIHYNKSLKEVSHVRNENLPISLLTKKDLNFSRDVYVKSVADKIEGLEFTFLATTSPQVIYEITLNFDKIPFQLSSIIVSDRQSSVVKMKLEEREFNAGLEDSVFEFKNPNFFKEND